ncbi:amidohydrolase family protein [Oceanidesulfovibrio marinus]|uniref:Amidohydrolase n=1 Tax=Oceanidesulfovibrio marinus TaxID=370038 RepID=A0A6P1ZPI1_9BACT|nr:amidohydrolase family protein [Oceanidesulfovibrio marinus]TVM36428.1 amidohydrolase [Oceanidesulfovibrio marinus]
MIDEPRDAGSPSASAQTAATAAPGNGYIDVHTHSFHPKIAHKVLKQLEGHYRIQPVGSGLLEDLLQVETAAGIGRMMVHSAATTPAQVIPANNWALELLKKDTGRIEPFGTVHPEFEKWESELDRLERAGIRGLKIHPDFQGFRLDDPQLFTILEAAADRFVFMIHVGDRLPPAENPSCPYKLLAIHEALPQAKIIAAHLGGYLHWQWVLETILGRNVYIDTSSSLSYIDQPTLEAIFERHPREYILFGSDWPLQEPKTEIGLLRSRLGLTDAEISEILANGSRLLPAHAGHKPEQQPAFSPDPTRHDTSPDRSI